jgi:hypothetical protein
MTAVPNKHSQTHFVLYLKQNKSGKVCAGMQTSLPPGAGATKFCTVLHNIFNTITSSVRYIHSAYQFTCSEQKAPDNSKVHRLLQICGPLEWDLPRVTILAPTIWRSLLEFGKHVDHLEKYIVKIVTCFLTHIELLPKP